MIATTPLVEAAQRGERGAVLELLKACQPDLQRFARRTCATAEDAEDAVQVALWQLHRRIGTLRTAAALAGWLFRIVERNCIRLFRGRKATDALDDLPEGRWAEALPVPLDLRIDLARAIEALPAPYRIVLILRDVHERTAPEVAAELGLSVDAVKSRLHRARSMMRARLMASGYWPDDEPATRRREET